MNLISKLAINYDECTDIVNPFYFEMTVEQEPMPVYIFGTIDPRNFLTGLKRCKVELSANPYSIKVDMANITNKTELTVFNRGQHFTLKHITHLAWSVSNMTGCIEIQIQCGEIKLGGITQ